MRNLRVQMGDGAIVTWTNKEGDIVGIPLINMGKGWIGCGVYVKYGTSKSDPKWPAIFPLPANWKPSERILRAIQRTTK